MAGEDTEGGAVVGGMAPQDALNERKVSQTRGKGKKIPGRDGWSSVPVTTAL